MFALLVGVLLVLCLNILYLYFRRTYGYWKERGVPYEEPTVFIGNLGHIMRTSAHDYMLKIAKTYKTDYFGVFFGQQPALIINSKELVKNILIKDFEHFRNRFSASNNKNDVLGSFNLFSVKNPILWSEMKHELAPMFTTQRMKHFTELMNENSSELVKRVQKDYIENMKPVNLKELFLMYTSDTIGYTVFGIRVSVLRDLTSPIWVITRHMAEWTFWRGLEFNIIFLLPALAKLIRLQLFSASATLYLKKIFLEIVEKRKKLAQPNNKDLLGHLINLKENFKISDKQLDDQTVLVDDLILAQAAVFILGAIATSANTLTMCLHELAYHPEQQERLYKEISTALEAKGKSVLDYNDLKELNYLTSCIKETLRRHPVIVFIERKCNKTYKLTEDVTIEKGIPIHINIPGIHLNEEYYPDPEQWQPERFEGSSENDNHNFTFIPFGEGPRACIGKRYGFMQVRTAIAHLLMKFRFEPAAPHKITIHPYSLIPVPLDGGKVKFVPR